MPVRRAVAMSIGMKPKALGWKNRSRHRRCRWIRRGRRGDGRGTAAFVRGAGGARRAEPRATRPRSRATSAREPHPGRGVWIRYCDGTRSVRYRSTRRSLRTGAPKLVLRRKLPRRCSWAPGYCPGWWRSTRQVPASCAPRGQRGGGGGSATSTSSSVTSQITEDRSMKLT